MSTKRKRRNKAFWVEFITLVVTGISIVVGWQVSQHTTELKDRDLLSLALGAACTIFFVIFTEFFTVRRLRESQTNDILDRIDGITSTSSIRVFKTAKAGLRHDIDIANKKKITKIKNTVLRYGNPSTAQNYSLGLYKQWVDVKRAALDDEECLVKEIISIYIGNNTKDQQMVFVNEALSSGKNYEASYLDDMANHMLQVCILEFEDNNGNKSAQVLFGHQFPNMILGQCFLSTDSDVVAYFDTYFEHWFTKGYCPSRDKTHQCDVLKNDRICENWHVFRYLYRENQFFHCDIWSICRTDTGQYNISINKVTDILAPEAYDYNCRVIRFDGEILNILIEGDKYPQQGIVCFRLDTLAPPMMFGLGAGVDGRGKTCTRIYLACKEHIGKERAKNLIHIATSMMLSSGDYMLFFPRYEDVLREE